jgi:hypothetical protein
MKINKINRDRNLKTDLNLFESESDLWLGNKNMHAMKCNLSNYLKISYCYLSEMH